jgi:hypothetical protein
MANKLRSEPTPVKTGPEPSYPWEQWITTNVGKGYCLRKDIDFYASLSSMRIMLYDKARRLGYRISVFVYKETEEIVVVSRGKIKPVRKPRST